MKTKIALASALLCASSQAVAVDGYKNLKFGMSLSEVLANQPCTLEEVVSPIPQTDMYACDDLSFGGHTVEAVAFFMKGKFLRFAIEIPEATAVSTLRALQRKYGKPSSAPSQRDIEKSGTVPGTRVVTGFDGNTVLWLIETLDSLQEANALIYTAPNYNALLAEAQAKDVSSDL